jgi:hypothetical protein
MKFAELLTEDAVMNPFISTKTDDKTFNDLMNPEYASKLGYTSDIKTMSPRSFIVKSMRTDSSIMQRKDPATISRYVDEIKVGNKLSMPGLLINADESTYTTGLQKVFAALEAGVQLMPVLIIKEKEHETS